MGNRGTHANGSAFTQSGTTVTASGYPANSPIRPDRIIRRLSELLL
jgi:hypothetical protein